LPAWRRLRRRGLRRLRRCGLRRRSRCGLRTRGERGLRRKRWGRRLGLGEQQRASEEKDSGRKACAQQERLATARSPDQLRDPAGPEVVHSIESNRTRLELSNGGSLHTIECRKRARSCRRPSSLCGVNPRHEASFVLESFKCESCHCVSAIQSTSGKKQKATDISDCSIKALRAQ
jgi:hypothetical protein